MAEQCVCEDGELSHDGCDGNCGWLTGGDEGLIFGFHVRVEADRDKGRHIERLAHVSASGAYEALGTVLA